MLRLLMKCKNLSVEIETDAVCKMQRIYKKFFDYGTACRVTNQKNYFEETVVDEFIQIQKLQGNAETYLRFEIKFKFYANFPALGFIFRPILIKNIQQFLSFIWEYFIFIFFIAFSMVVLFVVLNKFKIK